MAFSCVGRPSNCRRRFARRATLGSHHLLTRHAVQPKSRNIAIGAIITLGACSRAQDESTTAFTLRHGQVRFQAPTAWHVLQLRDDDLLTTLQQKDGAERARAVFHVRNPVTDKGRDRANVLVRVLMRPAGQELRSLSDTLFGQLLDPGALVLGDTMPAPNRRFFFWRGQQGATPYAIYDDFASRDTIVVHVRMTVPIVTGTSPEWSAAYERDTERLLASLMAGENRIFPDWAGHPQLAAFGP